MKHWLVALMARTVAWSFLGAICCALAGAFCGLGVACLFVPEYGSLQQTVFLVAAVIGAMIGGRTGALALAVLSLYCSPQRSTWKPPVIYVVIGMMMGTLAGMTLLMAVNLLWYQMPVTELWGSESLDRAVICGPLAMIFGQVMGTLYTALLCEPGPRRAERQRWQQMIERESDYDILQVNHSS